MLFFFFFFNDTATTEIYTLSLHDALPISQAKHRLLSDVVERVREPDRGRGLAFARGRRRDRGDEDELPVRTALQRLHIIHRHLGLVMAIGLEALGAYAQALARDVDDRYLLRRLRNLDVGFWILVLRGRHGNSFWRVTISRGGRRRLGLRALWKRPPGEWRPPGGLLASMRGTPTGGWPRETRAV